MIHYFGLVINLGAVFRMVQKNMMDLSAAQSIYRRENRLLEVIVLLKGLNNRKEAEIFLSLST